MSKGLSGRGFFSGGLLRGTVCALAWGVIAAGSGLGRAPLEAQLGIPPAPDRDARIHAIIDAASAARVEADIRTLANFGTRNTMSDTLSDTRGIGASRRWIKAEFDRISEACGGCLEVYYQEGIYRAQRIPDGVNVVNVIAVLRGTTDPNRYIIMSGDIDSRASDTWDAETDAPGANDNASGMAGAIEAARILTQQGPFAATLVFAGLSGEEQGLWGGDLMARQAREDGWEIQAVINNDMIGNIRGIDGVIDNTTFRVFSEAVPLEEFRPRGWDYRRFGGEVDGPSRQIARYIQKITDDYFTNLRAIPVYRLDRFGRGGHHTPFNNQGFPAVRIMETHENYNWQHQNIRVQNGIEYGDVIEHVDFDYAARLTAVNAAVMAAMAWAPASPSNVSIFGAVRASTSLYWNPVEDPNLIGYRVYWRDTTAPQWTHSRFVGDVTEFTFENMVIDNYLFGVTAVGRNGTESPVAFPTSQGRR
jgi:Zn-dependent M28 family amino/carboxypeptidase